MGRLKLLCGLAIAAWIIKRIRRRRKSGLRVRVVSKGRPLACTSADETSIVSFNILADCYTSNNQLSYVCPSHLRWSHRWPLLLAELVSLDADILCLQEVEGARWDEICSTPELQHYTFLLQDHAADRNVSNAMLFKTSRMRLTWTESRSRAQLVAFTMTDSFGLAQELYIANVHLEGSPYRPQDRINQMRNVLTRLQQQQQQQQQQLQPGGGRPPQRCSVVIAGDFNSQPGQTVCQLLHRGLLPGGTTEPYLPNVPVTKTTLSHPYALHDVYEAAGLQLPFTFVHKSPPASTVERILDFIWCSEHLDVTAVYCPILPEHLGVIRRYGLPNHLFPSDHLPVGAVIRINGEPPAVPFAGVPHGPFSMESMWP